MYRPICSKVLLVNKNIAQTYIDSLKQVKTSTVIIISQTSNQIATMQ
jgi:hypothetical protein